MRIQNKTRTALRPLVLGIGLAAALLSASVVKADDDCNSGRAGASCGQRDAFEKAEEAYREGAIAADGTEAATEMLNLANSLLGLANALNSTGSAAPAVPSGASSGGGHLACPPGTHIFFYGGYGGRAACQPNRP